MFTLINLVYVDTINLIIFLTSFPETISKSFVVLGYVRGRLLVENGDFYEDLQDIVSAKLAENKLNNSGKAKEIAFFSYHVLQHSTIMKLCFKNFIL